MKPLVLIIDDDEVFASDLELLLGDEYTCRRFADSSGIDEVTSGRIKPAVILLDVYLAPEQHGLDLLEAVRRYDKTIPVVMMTDQPAIPLVVEAVRRGGFTVLSKSGGMDELLITLRKAISFYSDNDSNM